MSRFPQKRHLVGILIWVCLISGCHSPGRPVSLREKTPELFAFCIDTHDAKKRTLDEQALMLKKFGFDGVGHLWLDQVPERLQSLDRQGLRLFQLYTGLNVSPGHPRPFDPRLPELFPQLKQHRTTIVLLMSGAAPSDKSRDEAAVTHLQHLADQAKKYQLEIALAPHEGYWLERMEDAVRLAHKVDRENVGIFFQLSHWLRVETQRDYEQILDEMLPFLKSVSIHGADVWDPDPGWSRYIQPLGDGSFDVFSLLAALQARGFSGPIGLQCYGLPGDLEIHLQRSKKTWNRYQERLQKLRK